MRKAAKRVAGALFVAGFAFLGFGVYLIVLLVNGRGGLPGFFGIIALLSNAIALAVIAFSLGIASWLVSRKGGKKSGESERG